MQPYFLPYLGYWQLIAAADKFVLLDDVNFIKGGWINRNRILVDGKPTWITLPLSGASPNRLIRDIEIASDNGWKRKMFLSIKQSYSSSDCLGDMLAFFEKWINGDAVGSLSPFLCRTINDLRAYLGLTTEIIPSSSIFPKGNLTGVDRVLDICARLSATSYVNAPGGRHLYEKETFARNGQKLLFVQPASQTATISDDGLALSIAHQLMSKPMDAVKTRVNDYKLTE